MKCFQISFIPHSLVENCFKVLLACNDCSLQFHLLVFTISLNIKLTPHQSFVKPPLWNLLLRVFTSVQSPEPAPIQAGFQGGPCSKEQKMLFQSGTMIWSPISQNASLMVVARFLCRSTFFSRLLEFGSTYQWLTCKQRHFTCPAWYSQSFVALLPGMRY